MVDEVTKLFRSGRKDEAAEIIPDELVDDAVIVGDIDRVRKQMAVRAAGVTMMVVTAGSWLESRCPPWSDRSLPAGCDAFWVG